MKILRRSGRQTPERENDMRLQDKSVVVTGASAGIGRAIVELFAQEGANIVAVARRLELLEELVEELKDAPGTVVPFKGDVSIRENNEAMIDCALKQFGRLDVLVNNAGIMDDMTAMGDVSDEMIEDIFAVNTFGPMYAMRKAAQVFLAQGDEDEGGVIVNIGSIGAAHHTAGVAYGASKAALITATKNTAFMYLDQGIRCNVISPGGVMTDIALSMPKSNEFGQGRMETLLPLAPELGMPEDIAQVALFLASDESHYVNGVVLTADGGWMNV
jgi:NAD(P)-dependent dehydrogenase (short-subunit alcohol dehydrogenase family)